MRAMRAGTDGGDAWWLGRIAAMVLALAVVLLLVLADAARAGTYRVAQCGWGIGAELDPPPDDRRHRLLAQPGLLRAAAGDRAGGDEVRRRHRARRRPRPGAGALGGAAGDELRRRPPHLVGQPAAGHLAGGSGSTSAATSSSSPAASAAPADSGRRAVDGPAWAFEAFAPSAVLGAADRLHPSTPSAMRLSGADPHRSKTSSRRGAARRPARWRRAGTGGRRRSNSAPRTSARASPAEAATIDGAPRPRRRAGLRRGDDRRRSARDQAAALPADGVAVGRSRHDPARRRHPHAAWLRDRLRRRPGLRPRSPDRGRQLAAGDRLRRRAAKAEVAATVSDRVLRPGLGDDLDARRRRRSWTDLPTELRPRTARDRDADRAPARPEPPGPTSSAPPRRTRPGTAARPSSGSPAAPPKCASRPRRAGARQRRRRAGRGVGATGRAAPRARRLGSPRAGVRSRAGARRRLRPAPLDVSRWPGASLDDRAIGRRAAGRGLTVDYGTAVELRGRLTDGRGAGVAGGRCVVARPAAGVGGPPERRRVVTDRGGRFELRLPAGTSRRVAVSFHGGGGFAPARAAPLALRVRAAVSLAAEPTELDTGESVRLRGRVRPRRRRASPPAASSSRSNTSSGRAAAGAPPSSSAPTPSGRFDIRYRFRYVTGEARIRLRATAPPGSAAGPTRAGSSAPVTVEVRGDHRAGDP